MTEKQNTLLIIDDEEEILSNLSALLEDSENISTIKTCLNGIEALEIISAGGIDCVVCDINMPHTNGYDVLKSCRTNGYDKPFIFFTGHANSGDEDLSQLDVLAFIAKTEVDLLEETIIKALA